MKVLIIYGVGHCPIYNRPTMHHHQVAQIKKLYKYMRMVKVSYCSP